MHVLCWEWNKLDWDLSPSNEDRSVLGDMGLVDDVNEEGRCLCVVGGNDCEHGFVAIVEEHFTD